MGIIPSTGPFYKGRPSDVNKGQELGNQRRDSLKMEVINVLETHSQGDSIIHAIGQSCIRWQRCPNGSGAHRF